MPWRAGANLAGVNPTLLALLQRAAENSRYIVQPTSGVRASGSDRLKGSAHHTGQATDIELIDPQTGKVIPNYQNAASAKAYQDFANQVYGSATPDQRQQLRWGGYFWNGGPGHYGNMDLMHFDYGTGQPMGAGSFEKGFAPNQVAAYKLPGSGTPAGQVMVASNAPVAPPGPAAAAAPAAPAKAGPMSSMESYIRQSAQARGIDPDIAVKVAMSEGGLVNPIRQSDVVNKGVRETSFGPFQLRIGGGLGDKALAAGIDPRKPEDAYKAVDFALDQVKQGGWGPWMGAKKLGITGMTGVGGQPVTRMSSAGGPGGGTPTGEAPSAANMAGPDVTATYGSSPGGPGGGTRTGQAPPPLAAQPTAVAGNFPPAPAAPQQTGWRDMLASAMAGMGKGFAALSQPGPRPDFTPQTSPSIALPAQPIIDPTVANNQRQQMAMALARLNSGQLYA